MMALSRVRDRPRAVSVKPLQAGHGKDDVSKMWCWPRGNAAGINLCSEFLLCGAGDYGTKHQHNTGPALEVLHSAKAS